MKIDVFAHILTPDFYQTMLKIDATFPQKYPFIKIETLAWETIRKRVSIMTANEKIIALIKPEYLNKIPKIFRKHATENTCKLIAREHPDLYKAFEEETSAEEKEKMKKIVNGIFEERMKKHKML